LTLWNAHIFIASNNFSGILLARFFKLILPKWFYIHAATQTIGIAGVVVAVAIVFIANNKIFVVGWHQVFGLIAFSGFLLQYFLGITSHFKFDPKRKFPPVFPDKIHWWFGTGIFVWALVTIFLGLRVYGAGLPAFVLYSIWVGVAVIVWIVLQNLVGQTHERSGAWVYLAMSADGKKETETELVEDQLPEKSVKHRGYFSAPLLLLCAVVLVVRWPATRWTHLPNCRKPRL